LQTWTVINDKSYDLAYVTDRTNFDISLALAQQMIDSFQIMGQSNVSPLSSVESSSIEDTDTPEIPTTTDFSDNLP
jgi:hypothetical protein